MGRKKNFLSGIIGKEKKSKKSPRTRKNSKDINKALKNYEEETKVKLQTMTMEAKEKSEQVRTEINEVKGFLHTFRGIRFKILGAIFVPIVLMAAFGIISYIKSSQAINTRYVTGTTDTLNAVSDYLSLGFKTVEQKSLELYLDGNVEKYYYRASKLDNLDAYSIINELNQQIIVSQSANNFLNGIHLIGEVGGNLSTASKVGDLDLFSGFLASDEGKLLEDTKQQYMWHGRHDYLDEQLKIKNSKYALTFIRKMNYDKGYIVMDISMEKIQDKLESINFGKGAIIGLVSPDGREVLSGTDKESIFRDATYYKAAIESEKSSDHSYQTYSKEKYLYLYSKVGETGIVICALIPNNTIVGQASAIKNLCIFFVLSACIFAIILGAVIAGGIGRNITKLLKSISKAAKGDLTVKFEIKGKDEFHALSNGLNDMVAEMRNLIGEVAGVGIKVSGSADLLSATSENILDATKDISLTIDEIEKGVVQQASDTELCLGQMSNLSEKINQVYGSTYEIEKIATDTKEVVGDGIVIIDELNSKSKATTDITHVVISEIEELEIQSRSIVNFVGIINEIASQTNLLSLNASIEAARAGEAGRGFAVVADEIRKLADQSVNAVNEIGGIVSKIQTMTKGTVVSAKKADEIVESQAESLARTVKVFEEINKHVAKLANNLDTIAVGVKGIETAKEDTLEAIRNIAAVSQETAASSEEVSATANNQIASVENLSQSAYELTENAKKLEEAIKIFTIS